MKLEVLLPSRILLARDDVLSIVAETCEGSFGLLPRRLDCVAALVPGILSYETEADGESFVAIDDGMLIKVGADVRVSVRRAMQGTDLKTLRAAVDHEFRIRDEQALALRALMTKLETGFVARFADFRHD